MYNKITGTLIQFAMIVCLCGISVWPNKAEPSSRALSGPETHTAPAQSTTAQVSATQGWQVTSIQAIANQELTLEVTSGQWTHWIGTVPYNNGVGGAYTCDPDMTRGTCVEPIPNIATGTLIGRIGSQVFAIRSGTTIIAQLGGLLYLRINDGDDSLSDNDGTLSVQIISESQQLFIPLLIKSPPALSVTKTVFTIAYIDATPLYDPDDLQVQLIADLSDASSWHGYENSQSVPALAYQTYGGNVIKLNEVPPYRKDNDAFDYAAVYTRFDLCSKIQAGTVDEVWVWDSGSSHAWEWVTNGPHWSWTWGSNVPNCGRTITTMNLNYQREVALALHSYGHRMEGAFMTWRPCDFYTNTWPWTGWPSQCSSLVSDSFGYVARPFVGNNNVGVCGDIHHPPNILDSREYVYNDLTTVQSICQDWQWTGSANSKGLSCTSWGCTDRGFMIWWMQNIPGPGNTTHDRDGTIMPNWWEYLFYEQTPPFGTKFIDQSVFKQAHKDYFFHTR
jgi:hypothetical protein